jgi:hypothetical protein
MELILKEDIKEAKERMDAWWDHEIVDRPVISYYIPRKGSFPLGYLDALVDDWFLAEHPDGIDEALTSFEQRTEWTYFGGEAIPSYLPNYGPGIVAAVFGVVPKFESRTVWFSRPTKPEDIIALLESVKLNQNNEWYSRLLKVTEYASKIAGTNYQISITDIGGVLDILSSFLGPTNILLTMKRKPEIIDTCREIIFEKLIIIYHKLQDIIERNCDGCNAWLNVWNRKRWYPVQCDFIAMLNPKWFKRFALPDIIAQIENMDYALYHMDGPYQIPYLDDFLSIPDLTGIEWVPGKGEPSQGALEWMTLYKKIQDAGKNIIIDTPPEKVPPIYKELDPKGLFVRTYYPSKRIAEYLLPSFMKGKEGKIVFEAANWIKEKGGNSITMEEFEKFLEIQNLTFDKKFKKELLRTVNNVFRERSIF